MAHLLTNGLGGPGAGLLTGGLSSRAVGVRTEDILADVIARLAATDQLYAALLDDPMGLPLPQDSPTAVVRDLQYWDVDDLDSHAELVRERASIVITVAQMGSDAASEAEAQLDRLSRLARRTLDRQSLGPGQTIPDMTRCTRSRETRPRRHGVNWEAELILEYAYLVDKDTGYDVGG